MHFQLGFQELLARKKALVKSLVKLRFCWFKHFAIFECAQICNIMQKQQHIDILWLDLWVMLQWLFTTLYFAARKQATNCWHSWFTSASPRWRM